MNDRTESIGRVPQWIACRGEARAVVGGEVACPRGGPVDWEHCLGCNRLEAVDHERDFGCGDFDTSGRFSSPRHSEPASRPELFIELI